MGFALGLDNGTWVGRVLCERGGGLIGRGAEGLHGGATVR